MNIYLKIKSFFSGAKNFSRVAFAQLPFTRYNAKGLPGQNKENLLKSFNSIVYTCAKINGDAVSDVNWNVGRIDNQGKIIKDNFSPEAVILRNVNSVMSYPTLALLTDLWLSTAGCAFWWVTRNASGVPTAIWPLPPQLVKIKTVAGFADIISYEFMSKGKSITIPAEEVVRFYNPSLSEPFLGTFSPLQAIWLEKGIWDEEQMNALALLQNHARPDAIISPKGDFAGMGDGERERLEKQLLNKFKRAGAGGILIGTSELSYQSLQMSSRDSELLARKEVTKTDIANAFGVPIALLEGKGINRATLEAAMFQLGFFTIKPKIKSFKETLNEFYFPMFGRDLKIFFDNPVPADKEREAKQEDQDLRNAVITVNEVREKRGLEAVPWGNEPHIPANLIQPSARIEIITAPQSTLAEGQRNVKRISEQNAKTIQDAYEAFIKYRTEQADYAMLARVCRSAEISQDTLNKWCKEITPMKRPRAHAHDSEKMTEWKALNSIPSHRPLQKIFRDVFSDQEQEILKALSKAAKNFDGIVIKQFPDDAVEFLDTLTLDGWEKRTAERSRPQIEIDTSKGIGKTNAVIEAGLGSERVLPSDFVGSRSVQEAISKQVIPLSDETVATTRRSLKGAVEALRKELREGLIEEGEALPSMVKRVQGIFTNAKRHRAEAIAITESNKAFNNGTLISAQESSVVRALKWVLSPEPCIICETIAGETPGIPGTPEVPIGGKFANTDPLFGDIEAPPAHVNCACTIETVLIDF